jgi:ribosomal protein L32
LGSHEAFLGMGRTMSTARPGATRHARTHSRQPPVGVVPLVPHGPSKDVGELRVAVHRPERSVGRLEVRSQEATRARPSSARSLCAFSKLGPWLRRYPTACHRAVAHRESAAGSLRSLVATDVLPPRSERDSATLAPVGRRRHAVQRRNHRRTGGVQFRRQTRTSVSESPACGWMRAAKRRDWFRPDPCPRRRCA